MSLRVSWFAVTDSVVISDDETEDEVEISRKDWLKFVAEIKAGKLSEPWAAAGTPGSQPQDGAT